MKRLSLRKDRSKFNSSRKLLIILKIYMEYTSFDEGKNRKTSTCNGFDRFGPKISPDIGVEA